MTRAPRLPALPARLRNGGAVAPAWSGDANAKNFSVSGSFDNDDESQGRSGTDSIVSRVRIAHWQAFPAFRWPSHLVPVPASGVSSHS